MAVIWPRLFIVRIFSTRCCGTTRKPMRKPGADGFRKSPQVKHTPVSVEPGQGRQRWPVVPEVAVVIILDEAPTV
jgi:hypothetical protein